MDGDGIGYNIQDIVISNGREKVPRIVCEYCVGCWLFWKKKHTQIKALGEFFINRDIKEFYSWPSFSVWRNPYGSGRHHSPARRVWHPVSRKSWGAKGLGSANPQVACVLKSWDLKDEHFCHLAGKEAERMGSSFEKQTHCAPITESVLPAFPMCRKPEYKYEWVRLCVLMVPADLHI